MTGSPKTAVMSRSAASQDVTRDFTYSAVWHIFRLFLPLVLFPPAFLIGEPLLDDFEMVKAGFVRHRGLAQLLGAFSSLAAASFRARVSSESRFKRFQNSSFSKSVMLRSHS
jgi:hypothetical protein